MATVPRFRDYGRKFLNDVYTEGAGLLKEGEASYRAGGLRHAARETAVRSIQAVKEIVGIHDTSRWSELPPVMRELLPRLYFLESFLLKMDELKSIVFPHADSGQKPTFYQQLNEALEDLKKCAEEACSPSPLPQPPGLARLLSWRSTGYEVPPSPLSSPRSPRSTLLLQVRDAIDNGIVKPVRDDPELATLFLGEVPGLSQKWEDIMEAKIRQGKIQVPNCGPEQVRDENWIKFQREGIYQKTQFLVGQIQGELDRSQKTYMESSIEIDGKPVHTTVFFVTDRPYTVDGIYSDQLLKERIARRLHYGWMEVSVPVNHRKGGKMDEPYGGEDPDQLKHVLISSDKKLLGDKESFFQSVNEHVKDAKSDEEENSADVLIFVHGYCSPLHKNVRRLAKLQKDLDLKGTVILYSWSSGDTKLGYLDEEKSVQRTPLKEFIQEIREKMTEAHSKIHLMAHSMGSRALIDALKRHFNDLKIRDNPHGLKPISQVVFAAADEEVSKFKELVHLLQEFRKCSTNQPSQSITRPVPTVTVYSNREDIALTVSHAIHFEDILVPKLGDTRSCRKSIESKELSLKTADFVDVVDATSVGISTFQHSYYCEIEAVLNDLKAVLQCRRAKERAEGPPIARTIHAFHLDNQLGTIYEFVKDGMKRSRFDRFTSNLIYGSAIGSGSH